MSYSKATSVAIKGDYIKGRDVPPEERYASLTNQFYKVPTVRSNLGIIVIKLDGQTNKESKKLVDEMKEKSESNGFFKNTDPTNQNEGINKNGTIGSSERTELCQSFKDILNLEKKSVTEVIICFKNSYLILLGIKDSEEL